MSTTF